MTVFKTSVKIFGYVLVLLLFQELVLRFCFPIPEISNFDRVNYSALDSNQVTQKHLRNRTYFWQSSLDTDAVFDHYMNQYGFRDKEWTVKKKPSQKRVFFVGDSFTEGIMAEQGNDLVSWYESAANANGQRIDVMNAGMMGVGMNSYLQLIVDAVPIFKPDAVVLMLYANDFSERKIVLPKSRIQVKYYNFWKPRLWEIVSQMKAGYPLLFRWSLKRSPFLPAVPAANNPFTSREAELAPHVKPEILEAMKSGTFNCFVFNQIMYQEQVLKKPLSHYHSISFLKDFLHEQGTELLVSYIPYRAQVTSDYYRFEQSLCQIACPKELDLTTDQYQVHRTRLAEDCESLGVSFIDCYDTILSEEDKGNQLYWNYDDHMRVKGYRILGETLFKKSEHFISVLPN